MGIKLELEKAALWLFNSVILPAAVALMTVQHASQYVKKVSNICSRQSLPDGTVDGRIKRRLYALPLTLFVKFKKSVSEVSRTEIHFKKDTTADTIFISFST